MTPSLPLDAIPEPSLLIKSIAEQGYSLDTAIADLVDNAITAGASKIRVLVDSSTEPFRLFVADNGRGMTPKALIQNMRFPSSDPSEHRMTHDLGRFGLGMKTASFSQTRRFTVISKTADQLEHTAITWDVNYLEKTKKWQMLQENKEFIVQAMSDFRTLDNVYMSRFDDFEVKTVVIWEGLYKFENYLDKGNRKNALNREIAQNTTEHLGIVFHRFLSRAKECINISVNNWKVVAFDPFPESQRGLRKLEFKQKSFGEDRIKLEAFVLPSVAIEEAKSVSNPWTTPRKSLSDMEGVYIYRSDRLIIYGTWNGLVRKAPRRQLARMKVEIGNNADHLLHLNVAKSKVIVPHDLIEAFKSYIDELISEAEKEFYNRSLKKFPRKDNNKNETFLTKISSNKGTLLEVNKDHPVLTTLLSDLNKQQHNQLNLLLRMFNTNLNKIRNVHSDLAFDECQEVKDLDLVEIVSGLLKQGFSADFIRKNVIDELGVSETTIPDELLKQLD